jgi:hypothetical protein
LSQGLNLFNGFGGRGQIVMTILSDVNIVLDTDTSDIPVPFQDSGVNVFARLRVIQHRVDNEAAEIDLRKISIILSGEGGDLNKKANLSKNVNLHQAQQ